MEEDSFVESVESLIKSVKDLIVRPVKRLTGFASLGLLLVVLLITAVIFLFSGILKIMPVSYTHLTLPTSSVV